jgi:hypothetical protein
MNDLAQKAQAAVGLKPAKSSKEIMELEHKVSY